MKIQDNVGYYFTIQDLQDRLRVESFNYSTIN